MKYHLAQLDSLWCLPARLVNIRSVGTYQPCCPDAELYALPTPRHTHTDTTISHRQHVCALWYSDGHKPLLCYWWYQPDINHIITSIKPSQLNGLTHRQTETSSEWLSVAVSCWSVAHILAIIYLYWTIPWHSPPSPWQLLTTTPRVSQCLSVVLPTANCSAALCYINYHC